MKLPGFIQYCFWSYDLSSIDIEKDKHLVIQQVLNYGDWRAIKWLLRVYNDREIKKVLKSPRRGIWWRQVLNFWFTIFNLHIPKDAYTLAIKEIDPAKVDQRALERFFKRQEYRFIKK